MENRLQTYDFIKIGGIKKPLKIRSKSKQVFFVLIKVFILKPYDTFLHELGP